ncbi:uncharacterized protein LOC105437746 [Strongylocentrotus purpuratus]|uniref:Uncharacterized protein n=1 Tax=Strongylocentrotus purpuratus TaxID=7668 RepID=A0A7M7NS50_STRPU|nr:uncharacterized protein LOC105437746 [Strongylocentrotus purpuratus]
MAHDLLSLVDAAALKVTGNLNPTLYALKVIPHHLLPSIRGPNEQHHPALAAAIAISEQKESRIQDIDITSLNLSDRTNNLFLNTLLKGRQAATKDIVKKHRSVASKEHRELRILMNSRVTGQEMKAVFKKSKQLQYANIHVRSKRLTIDQCGTDLVERVLDLIEKELLLLNPIWLI